MGPVSLFRKFGVSTSGVGFLFALVNSYVARHIDCDDCAIKGGVPFPFRQSEGFATTPRFLWVGLIENLAVILVIAAVIALVWNWVGNLRRANSR
jgi:hypothetical protein